MGVEIRALIFKKKSKLGTLSKLGFGLKRAKTSLYSNSIGEMYLIY